MSDRTRRIVCRLTFGLFCLFPTLVVVNWAVFPRTVGEWQTALQPNVGLLLRFGKVSTRTPFKTVFTTVQVADPQRRLLAILPRVVWAHEPPSHTIELAPFEIARDELTRGCRQLLSVAPSTTLPLTLVAPSIRIVDSDSAASCTIHDLRILVQASSNGTALSLTFKTDPAALEPVRWEFQASLGGIVEAGTWELRTGPNLLPAWLLASEVPALGNLGTAASWQGEIVAQSNEHQHVHDVRGLIVEHVELETCLSRSWGLGIIGQTRLEIPAARLIDGRIESLIARVECGPGKIPRGLLNSLCRWLRLSYTEPSEESVEFSRIAFELEIRDNQVAIRNLPQANAIVWQHRTAEPIAAAGNESQGLPVHVLGCGLARENAYAVPADPRILALLGYLPLE